MSESWDSPEPTLPLDCELFELTEVGAQHWVLMDAWNLDESALLLAGASPARIREFDKDTDTPKPDYTSCGYVGIRDRLQRAVDVGVLSFPALPRSVVEWAQGKHAIPAPLAVLLETKSDVAALVPTSATAETVAQRRARYLAWHIEESRTTTRGALQRVYEREAVRNPKADRSNIGKDIRKAKAEKQKLASPWGASLVRNGRRQS